MGGNYENHLKTCLGCYPWCGRPEHLTMSDKKGDIAGVIDHVEMIGAETLYYLATDDYSQILVSRPTSSGQMKGKNIFLSPQSGYMHFFKNGRRINPISKATT